MIDGCFRKQTLAVTREVGARDDPGRVPEVVKK